MHEALFYLNYQADRKKHKQAEMDGMKQEGVQINGVNMLKKLGAV